MEKSSSHIRNFVIVAHVDHGKSTLADRFLEITGTVPARQMKEQYLDQLELERERGITIKMAPVRMLYKHPSQINADNDADQRGLLYEDLTYKMRGAIFNVYNKLGPSFKENVYGNALEEEFKKNGLEYEREKSIDIIYEGKKIGVYKPDFIVEGKIILEIKAQPFIGKLEIKQVWHYLKGSSYRLALLVNFGSRELQIERIVYDAIRENPRFDPRKSAQVEYILNLIDTPGHSDFSYEVSRALAAVEGAILLVDATQGIQAQTLANFRSAQAAGLKIIGAVNKIDLFPDNNDSRLENAVRDLAELLGVAKNEIFLVSGKTGQGAKQLLDAVVSRIPFPKIAISNSQFSISNFARALIFDSFYDNHKGVVASVRIFNGKIEESDGIKLLATETDSKIKETGYFTPQLKPVPELSQGEIGYIATGIKDPQRIKIGDTIITNNKSPAWPAGRQTTNYKTYALHGYKEAQPVVFVSFYPEEADDYESLRSGLEKLHLNDSSLKIESDQNEVLGRGFKVGFLGRLHFEITSERLKREFSIPTINTFPSVLYKVKVKGVWREIVKPEDLPEEYEEIFEPMISIEIIVPSEYVKKIYPLQNMFRMSGIVTEIFHERIKIKAKMPLAELVSDFDDKLKSVTRGFASFSYELIGYEKADIVKVDILVAGNLVSGLSRFFPRQSYEREARTTVERLKKLLPRQQFAQSLQAFAEGRVIAREDIPALRKDVTGYLYGGDRTRKMKLWKKQQRGKKKLKTMAKVRIAPEIFKELLNK